MNCIYKINNAADDVQWSRIIETNPWYKILQCTGNRNECLSDVSVFVFMFYD
jgi:hypothetical protein